MKERIPPPMPTITMCQLYILTHFGTGLNDRDDDDGAGCGGKGAGVRVGGPT